jgi:hypothetical protein
MTTFYCLRLETPSTLRPGPRFYIPQEQGGPVIPPGTGFPIRHLLRLTGLRWRSFEPASTPWRASLVSLVAKIRGGPNTKYRPQQCLHVLRSYSLPRRHELVESSRMLRPTGSRPDRPGTKHPSGAHDQTSTTVRKSRARRCGPPDQRSSPPTTTVVGPRQRSQSRVQVPRDLRPHSAVSDSRLPPSSPLTTRRATVEALDPASTWD